MSCETGTGLIQVGPIVTSQRFLLVAGFSTSKLTFYPSHNLSQATIETPLPLPPILSGE